MGLNDPVSSTCVRTERRVNAQLGGNCHVPLAVFCTPVENNQLLLQAKIFNLNGDQTITSIQTGSLEQATELADLCSQSLLAQGAAELLASVS